MELDAAAVSSGLSKLEIAVSFLLGFTTKPRADNFCVPDDAAANSSNFRFFLCCSGGLAMAKNITFILKRFHKQV